jgi:hypothetical protein
VPTFPSFARSAGRTFLAWVAALLVLVPGARPIAAQDTASVEELTAAILFNFAKFTEWPSDAIAADAPILLCSTDQGVADVLAAITNGKAVGARKIASSRVLLDQSVRQCSILHAPKLDERRTTALITSLRGTSVLSIGDSGQFTKSGGVAHIFQAGDRLKFAVNVAAAERARLHLSSRLLTLAQIVRE